MYVVCGRIDDNVYMIGQPFVKDDVEFVEKLITIPVMTAYGTIQPEDLWIEETGENNDKRMGAQTNERAG